ncbi:MAG: 3-hydroxy-3-methylglutaryl CoA synthase [Deltaproteobacteria bacterium]|nr:MAG: 3-hydroxy-3-methylglutaryl CoA synthase [Deltaproteobacteria bacterium]
MVGICMAGAYVPRYRLSREKIFQAMGWLNPATRSLARGQKAVANYDEDSVTMAVSATMECRVEKEKADCLYFASTTMPYQERQNAGIIATALGMREDVRTADFTGSLKAGTTALISALETVVAGGCSSIVVCASDCRLAKMGGQEEMFFGDGSATAIVGKDDVIAEYKGSFSLSVDFVDRFRTPSSPFGRAWEDRWIRDAGYDKIIPRALNSFLKKYDLKLEDFSKVLYCCPYPSERRKLNKKLGLKEDQIQNFLMERVGDTGVAQPLVMLASVLENARAGDNILLLSYGNGCDAIWFEVTDSIGRLKESRPLEKSLDAGVELDPYEKYLVWRDVVPFEAGLRAEHNPPVRWSLVWRLRRAILGFCGSRCTRCGTPQFPPQRVCVNPACGAIDEMEDYYFSDKEGKVASFTGDNLAATVNPPQIYGHVLFEGGGKVLMDFTDCNLDTLHVGMPVTPVFRVKDYDRVRGTTRYGWKVKPV